MDFQAESDKFDAYLLDHIEDMPQVWIEEGADRESEVPPVFSLVSVILRNMNGITHDEAWDMPINLMASYRCTILESQGYETLSKAEVQALELKKQIEAASRGET